MAIKYTEVRREDEASEIIVIEFIGEDRPKKVLLFDLKGAVITLIGLRLKLYMLIEIDQLCIESDSELNSLIDLRSLGTERAFLLLFWTAAVVGDRSDGYVAELAKEGVVRREGA